MSILRVEVVPIALPFRETYRTASGELEGRSMAVVRIHDSGGEVGTGEAVPLSLRGGPGLGQVAEELSDCGPALAGVETETPASRDPGRIRSWIWECLGRARRQRAGPQAICGLDVALHDLAGRLSAMPMWRLLGASRTRDVHCNASIDASDPDRAAAAAARLAAQGFRTFKIKVGTEQDYPRVAAVRARVGDSARIRIDANGAWEPEEAVRNLRSLQPLGIEFVEQPCAEMTGLSAVRGRTPIPVVADESVAGAAEAEAAVAARACDAVTIKLAKVGGPLEALRVAAIAPALLSSALDGPIGIAAAVHTAQVMPRGGYAAGFAHGLATLEMFSETYGPEDGLFAPVVAPPRRPGHGIEVDPLRLREFALT